MSYKVRIESFEGPFDLLLYLVSRQKVDIGAISITDIIDQFLAEMQQMRAMDLDVASDFLLVAATLLKIKAESLLPQEREAELDEDIAQLAPSEARDMLVERLVTYKQYKNAASNLQMRFEAQGRLHTRDFGPGEEFAGLQPDFLRDVDLERIGRLAAGAFARREAFLLDAEHIAAKPIPVETYVTAIKGRIQNKRRLRFSDLCDARTERAVIVVTFLAVLELYKRGVISIEQREEFGDIEMRYLGEGTGAIAGGAGGAAIAGGAGAEKAGEASAGAAGSADGAGIAPAAPAPAPAAATAVPVPGVAVPGAGGRAAMHTCPACGSRYAFDGTGCPVCEKNERTRRGIPHVPGIAG